MPVLRNVSILLCLLILGSCHASSSRNAAVVYASSSTTTTTTSSSSVASSSSSSSGNAIGGAFNYVKNSFTRLIDGGQELWVNYGTCQDIRAKIKAHQDACRDQWLNEGRYEHANDKELKERLKTVMGGISFEEYDFLQKGKEDRSKLMSLAFICVGAPRFLPYALMFQPDMLPRPMKPPPVTEGVETMWEKLSRERSAVVLETLLQLEKDAHNVAPGLLAKVNVFGRSRQRARMERMRTLNRRVDEFLHTTGLHDGARAALDALRPWLYYNDDSTQPMSRAVSRLSQVPLAVTKGLGDALLGGGLLNNLSPAFMQRGRLVGHLRKIHEADAFLVDNNVNVTTIPSWLLRETCRDRLMGNPGMTTETLQASLREWLTLVEEEPRQRTAGDGSCRFHDNLARTVLLSYFALQGTQDEGTACRLPRALYQSESPPSVRESASHSIGARFRKR